MTIVEMTTIELLDDTLSLPVNEVLAITRIERSYLIEMVDAGIVTPSGMSVDQWTFASRDLRRLRIARRLIADLDVNAAGAAVILDLLEERNALLRLAQIGELPQQPFR
jgi:chaperone modulatory protein CbpM